MKTVQMTLDENLIKSVDKIVKATGTTRSAFTRDALRQALKNHRIRLLEEKHRKGYERSPVRPGEFSVWEDGVTDEAGRDSVVPV
jgi:predicted DNA-binding WGR domain protein